MFIIEAALTHKTIGKLVAKRTGPLSGYDDEHEYVIAHPELFAGIKFRHRYSDNWLVFVQRMVQAALDSDRAKELPQPPKGRRGSFAEQLDEEMVEHLLACAEIGVKE